ncbi:hypothetical protein FNF28_00828 [Cafeteria roenbergensis]|uniref:Uncharacterized protein n=1 Tax=Cafeteria roenbergensis TaxID=33653 RepID=A0A5A8E3D2_CAFRO|nr:hypothetical protein FNF28_00828 [Cafeteria roenbergensis]
MGFDSQARDPVCMASHAPEEAPALNSTGPGGREAPLMELVLTARAVEDAPWAAVAGLRPFLVLHQEGALRLCVGVGGDYPRLEELRGRFSAAVQARKQRVQEWAQASGAQREQTAPGPATPAGLPAPASPFSDSTDDDDHAALAELALTMERLACDPRAPRRRFVFDLDCSGAVGRIGAGDEEGDPPTGAELEAALARLDEEPEADDEDADAESDQGQPLSPEELLRRRSDVHLARIASSGAAAPRGRRRQAHRGVTAFLKHQSTERQRLETRAAAAGAARPADGDAAAAPSPSPSPPSPPSGAEGEGGDPLGPSPADGRCRRLNPAAERYVLLPCGGAGSVTNILPALPWPFAGEVVSDAWDGATVAVRAFGRLGLSFALADVSDALERGTDPGDVVSLLYAEGALTDSAADADDLRSESAEPDSARRGASGGPTAASEAATASSSAVVGPGAGDGPDHRRRVSLGDGAPHKSEAFVRSAAAANGGGDGRPRSGGGGDGGGESGTESGSFGYEAATAALLSCPSSCPNNAGFANRVATALPTSEFPLVSAAPAFSDRWLGMEGQLLALPDVGFYSPLRSHGFVDVGRVAAECSSLEAGSVKALIRARMNGLVLLQHDLEDLTTYSLLGQELERAGVPGPRQPGDAVDVDALVVASARRAAAAAAGACNADAGAALLLASEAAWESMESAGGSAGGSAGSGAARSYFALRWAMLPNTNEQAWAALVRTPWKDLVQATGRGAQASRRLGAAADAVDPSCGRAFSASREDGARALVRSAAVTQLYQGTWACLLEASWWLRTARVVAMAQGEDALSSQLPLPQGLGGRAADGEEGDDGSADAPDEEEDAVGSCLTWPWPRGMAEARVPEERLQLPSQEARTGGVGPQAQRHRPTDRACAEASRLLSAARAAVGHWRKRFPELGRRWQITGPDPDLDARPLFWRDTEPMSPRSVAELLNGPLRWRWQALCRKASAETGRA